MAREPRKKILVSAVVEPGNMEDQIRARAYELYEERGKEPGHDVDDWLQAEAEITAGGHRSTAA